jgi:hypothetical protein
MEKVVILVDLVEEEVDLVVHREEKELKHLHHI